MSMIIIIRSTVSIQEVPFQHFTFHAVSSSAFGPQGYITPSALSRSWSYCSLAAVLYPGNLLQYCILAISWQVAAVLYPGNLRDTACSHMVLAVHIMTTLHVYQGS
jgi:hypothetical protein